MTELAPPSSVDLEEAIIGALLLNSIALEDVVALVEPKHFYNSSHKEVYSYMVRHETQDMLEIESGLDRKLYAYTEVPSSQPEKHAKIIRKHYLQRYLISELSKESRALHDINADVEQETGNLFKVLDEVQTGTTERRSLTPMEIYKRDLDSDGGDRILFGDYIWDEAFFDETGFRKKQNTVVYGISGHGKSSLGMYFVSRALLRGYKIAWFQLEDTDTRTASLLADVVRDEDKLANCFIADNIMDIDGIEAEARRLNKEYDLDMVVIDNIQLVETGSYRKREKVEQASMRLTSMYKKLNVAGLTLSQSNIKNEDDRRGDKSDKKKWWKMWPEAGDWADSSQIRKDAGYILSLFRPSEYEDLHYEDPNGDRFTVNWKGKAELPFNFVGVKPVKLRGQKKQIMARMIHTNDKGLQMYKEEPNF